MNEAEHLARSLGDAAAMPSTHVVAAPLDTGDRLAIPTVSLSADKFMALFQAIRPPVIYLFESVLNVDQEVESALDEAAIEEDAKAAKAVRRAAERMSAHEGETARVFAEVVTGGVHHVTYTAASWINAFEKEVEAIAAKAAEDDATRARQASAATNAHARGLAGQLVADPAFNSGRVSFAKTPFPCGRAVPGRRRAVARYGRRVGREHALARERQAVARAV